MSASPAGARSGPASTTPNGASAGMIRKKPKANPLVVKKKPVQKKAAPTPTAASKGVNGAADSKSAQTSSLPAESAPEPDDDPSKYSEFPLVATKASLLQGLRHHAMRMMSHHEVNPYDPSQFTRPLRLHRRFPRDQKIEPMPADPVDDKEREKEEIRKAERQAQKEANQAQIAPTEKAQQQKKKPQFKKKVEDVYYPQDTPEAKKRAKLRYEEGRPWHLEDFDGKNTWIGSYEEPLSETHAMFVLDNNGTFRMVPLEKWYKMTPTNRYKTMDLDEAEKHMAKKVKDSRWFIESSMSDEQRKRMEAERRARLLKGRVGMRGERGVKRRADDEDGEGPEIAEDADEIDFDAEDEFQDDDEGKLFGGDDDDVKESERKIRQEQLGANIFAGTGVKEEKDWDEEEEKEKKKADEERRRQRKLRRALVKNERKFEYESESDHPYSDDSESEDDELIKDEDAKKDENGKVNGDKAASGPPSAGTNTPSGRVEKHGLHAGLSLKRPGSPNLSEASGSESSRKRVKKEVNGLQRPMSPDSRAAHRRLHGAGSGSDTEASGNERTRPKIRGPTSRNVSPTVSAPSSRPTSPPPRPSSAVPVPPNFPTAEQVRNAIPPQGITISALINEFRSVISKTDKQSHPEFIRLVKSVGRNSPTDRLLIIRK